VELGLAMESASKGVMKLDQHHEVNHHKQFMSKNDQSNTVNEASSSTKDKGKAAIPNGNGKKDMVCYCCGGKGHNKAIM